jgi:hypothetical protein
MSNTLFFLCLTVFEKIKRGKGKAIPVTGPEGP